MKENTKVDSYGIHKKLLLICNMIDSRGPMSIKDMTDSWDWMTYWSAKRYSELGVKDGYLEMRNVPREKGVRHGRPLIEVSRTAKPIPVLDIVENSVPPKKSNVKRANKFVKLQFDLKEHDERMAKILPMLATVRGNPWGSIAVQWGAM